MFVETYPLLTGYVVDEIPIQRACRDLSRRPQPGKKPLHQVGFADDYIDVIAIDSLTHLESDPRGMNVRQDHWTQTFGTGMGLNCCAARVEQDV
jgi:hypothetical protein